MSGRSDEPLATSCNGRGSEFPIGFLAVSSSFSSVLSSVSSRSPHAHSTVSKDGSSFKKPRGVRLVPEFTMQGTERVAHTNGSHTGTSLTSQSAQRVRSAVGHTQSNIVHSSWGLSDSP
jgi:hypothetical protein